MDVPREWRDWNGARECNVVRFELLANNNAIRPSMRTLLSSGWRMLESMHSQCTDLRRMRTERWQRWALTCFLRCRTYNISHKKKERNGIRIETFSKIQRTVKLLVQLSALKLIAAVARAHR